MIDLSGLPLLKGKKALVTGIANDQSIAYGCAKALHAFGADLAITYLNDKAKPYVEPLAKELGASIFMPLNLQVEGQLEAVFEEIGAKWGQLDIGLHSICFRAEGGSARACGGLLETGLSPGHGYFLLVVHPHGQARRALDEGGGYSLDHDLLRLADGR
jgi:hypothetical protein